MTRMQLSTWPPTHALIRDDLHVAMLYVTHDPKELAGIADETLVLEQGRVVRVGRTADVAGTW